MWFDAVWNGVVWCGVWHSFVWFNVAWFGLTWFYAVDCGVEQFDFDMLGLGWFCSVCDA